MYSTVYSTIQWSDWLFPLVGAPLDGIRASVGGQRSTEQPRPRVDGDSNLPKEFGDKSSNNGFQPWNRYMYMFNIIFAWSTTPHTLLTHSSHSSHTPHTHTHSSHPLTARTRLQARLKHSSPTPTLPPPFVYINPPVSMVTRDVLMSRDALVAVVKVDLQCIFGQARWVGKHKETAVSYVSI